MLIGIYSGAYESNEEGVFMPLERINPPDLFTPSGYYHVVKDGDTVYVAGQVGVDKDRNLGADAAAQVEQTFKNLQTALASVGSDLHHLKKITVYLAHREDIPTYREIRARYVPEEFAGTGTLVIAGLASADVRIEIDAIASIP